MPDKFPDYMFNQLVQSDSQQELSFALSDLVSHHPYMCLDYISTRTNIAYATLMSALMYAVDMSDVPFETETAWCHDDCPEEIPF